MKPLILALVRPDNQGYLAECLDLPVSARAATLNGSIEKLRLKVRRFFDEPASPTLGDETLPKLLVTFHCTEGGAEF